MNIEKCPKCGSAKIIMFKKSYGLKCNNCKLSIGPFENEKAFDLTIKLIKRKSDNHESESTKKKKKL